MTSCWLEGVLAGEFEPTLFGATAFCAISWTGCGATAIELGKSAFETEAVFSLSSDEGGGEGRGEELCFIGFPLSPLVPRGERECMCKVHSNLNPKNGS